MEPEQPPADSSDEQMSPSATTTTVKEQQRSYECNFCKRGFTNAQALGGHMNIHRKNKPKFKHSSSSSSSTAAPQNLVAESPSPTRPRLSPTTTTVANPFSISHQGNLFSVPAQADENKSLIPPFQHHDTAVPRNIDQPGNPSPPEGEVDLELRLGNVEPPPESSSENKTTTTRKFF